MSIRNLYIDLAELVGQRVILKNINNGVNFDNATKLGKIIKLKRKSIGTSQKDLAELAGVGRRFVSELERGKHSVSLNETLSVCHAANLQMLVRQYDDATISHRG